MSTSRYRIVSSRSLVGFAPDGERETTRFARASRRSPMTVAASMLAGCFLSLGATSPAQALTWNWTADTAGCPSSGTLETDGTDYAANQQYTVTSISGTLCSGWTLTGLNDGVGYLKNTVSWDGTQNSQLLANSNGVFFDVTNGIDTGVWYWASSSFDALEPISQTNYNGAITFSQLTPANSPEPVPGSLPLMGAAAAFGWSRRMRRRLKVGTEAN